MGLTVSDNGASTFKPIPQGAHLGRCYRVIDLGTHDREYQGQPKPPVRQVMLFLEMFGEDETGAPLITPEGSPLVIAKRYTLSLADKANLRADLQAWRGRAFTAEEAKGFELTTLLGVPVLINVTHTFKEDKTYSNVAGLSPLPKAMRAVLPDPVNKPQFFNVNEPDQAVFETFSEKLQNRIKECHEWRKEHPNATAQASVHSSEDPDSDIPF